MQAQLHSVDFRMPEIAMPECKTSISMPHGAHKPTRGRTNRRISLIAEDTFETVGCKLQVTVTKPSFKLVV